MLDSSAQRLIKLLSRHQTLKTKWAERESGRDGGADRSCPAKSKAFLIAGNVCNMS